MKLTDSQLVILSTAAKRADGSILPLPKSVKLNKGAATLVLKSLLTLGAPQLRAEWTSLFGNPAPRRVSRDILLRGIAYRLQEKMYGGLKPATVKRLKRIASGIGDEG